MPAGHNDASMAGPSHGTMAMASVSCHTAGFDTESCCLKGDLTYPTAQLRASVADGSSLQVAVGFVVPRAELPPRFGAERNTRSFAASPPTPLYTLHSTFRI
jgi:hypothetical protein